MKIRDTVGMIIAAAYFTAMYVLAVTEVMK